MARINYRDLIDEDAFPRLHREAESYLIAINALRTAFAGILEETQKLAGGKTPVTMEGIQQIIRGYGAAKQAAEGYVTAEEKIRLGEIRLAQAREKAFDKFERQEAQKERATAREIANQKRLSREYVQVSSKLTRLTHMYQDLAAKKLRYGALNDKEERQMGLLAKRVQYYDAALKSVDATVGRHQRNVGNYTGAVKGLGHGMNGLAFSVAQISRELPNFAQNMQIGFMAISNNIPILSDQIRLLNLRNKELALQGKPTVSVLKEIGKAIFSWQSAMTIGITIMLVYGERIVDFFRGISKAERQRKKDTEEATKSLNESAAQEKARLEILLATAKDTTASYNARRKAVKDLRDQYPAYLKDLKDEEILAGELGAAYEAINEAIYAKIGIGVYNKELEAVFKREREIREYLKENAVLIKNQAEIEADYQKQRADYINKFGSEPSSQDLPYPFATKQIEDIRKRQEELKQVEKERRQILLDIQELSKKIKVDDPDGGKGGNGGKDGNPEADKANEARNKELAAYGKYLQERLDKQDGYEWESEQKRREFMDRGVGDALKYEDLLTKISKDEQKKRDDQKEADRKAEEKQRRDDFKAALAALEEFNKDRLDMNVRSLDRQLDASKRQADQLKDLAAQGNKDAQQSIAAEERKQAELERKREQQIKRQKQQELVLAGIKTYSAKTEAGEPNALGSTIRDVTVLTAFLKSMDGFFEGTENIADSLGKPQLKGRDGYIVRVDGSERVMTGKQNAKVGDLTNDQLANIADMYNKGLLLNYGVPKTADRANHQMDQMADKVGKQVVDALKGIEIHNWAVNEKEKFIIETVKTATRTHSNYYSYLNKSSKWH